MFARLRRFGYRYRLDRRWRKEVVKDWRRRSGFIDVEVVDDVRCVVKIVRGYVHQFQLVGSVRSSGSLNKIVSFLRDVFGVSVSEADVVSNAVSSRPDPNRLKSLSWAVVRSAKEGWLPVTGFGRWLGEKIVKKLEKDSWIEVVSSPRVGKSSGIVLGLMRWIIEHGIDNYVVLIVVVNRRLGRQLYKYALGAWKRLLKDLRRLGWNAGMLTEKIRIRYYEGMENGCLLGKVHRIEDCKRCPLFQLYWREWRKVFKFPVPVMDPVILRLSGYCPFQVLFSLVFWRNSFVIVSYKMRDLVVSILERLGIKRVVIYFDEYLVHLNHSVVLKKIDRSRIDGRVLNLEIDYNGRRIRFCDVVNRYNELIEKVVDRIFRCYDVVGYELYERESKDDIGLYYSFSKYVEKVMRGDIDLSGVAEEVYDDFSGLVKLVGSFYKRYRLGVFRRFLRYVKYTFASFFKCECDAYECRVVFSPEVVGSGIASAFGGYVYAFVSRLRMVGREVYVVTSSVDDSDFQVISSAVESTGVRIVAPCDDLKYYRLSVVYYRGVVEFPSYGCVKDRERLWRYVRSLRYLFEELRSGVRNDAVILDKESMLILSNWFEKLGWKVHYSRDDENPNVVDYVVVYRPNGSIILMFHPHGRSSMGVDPPYRDSIESVIFALGLRSYPRHIVPVPRVFTGIGRELEGRAVTVDGVPGAYGVVRGGMIYVYDVFSLKYDVHLVVQVIGRFFLGRFMRFVLLNPRYGIKDLKFFIFVPYVDVRKSKYTVGRVFKVEYVHKQSGHRYKSEFEVKLRGISFSEVRPVAREVRVDEFVESDSRYRAVDVHRVRKCMYESLRNVYNSLRYVRKQLRYGRQPDKWWLVKKVVYLLNGFEYARRNNLSVPMGLKTLFRKYVECVDRSLDEWKGSRFSLNLDEFLEYLRNRYLQNIDNDIWCFIKSYIYKITRWFNWLVV